MKTILFILGTRPEVIKLAPLIIELKRMGFNVALCNTEQQKELSNQTLRYFNLQADINLDIMMENQSLTALASRLIEKLDKVINESLDFVIVQGDTMSAFCGAFVSFLKKVPIVHVEAGLRSNNLMEPFPEEGLRQMISRLAAFNCAPTDISKENLLKEGVPLNKIQVTGNTVIDSLLHYLPLEIVTKSDNAVRKLLPKDFKKLVLVTVHRRENHGDPLINIIRSIKELSDSFKDVLFVWPVHPNPNVSNVVKRELSGLRNIVLTEPLDYPNLVSLMKSSTLILTDSGGIQEEATAFGVPILVLREVTERPEGIVAGCAQLVGSDVDRIIRTASKFLENDELHNHQAMPYGDGTSTIKIINYLASKKDDCE